MNLTEKFNGSVLDIWDAHCFEPTLMPSQYPHLPQNVNLLVLGMNPSFGAGWIQREIDRGLLGPGNTTLRAEDVYGWQPKTGPKWAEHLLKIEEYAFENYLRYFGPLKSFALAVGCDKSFGHLDLFQVRRTCQRDFLAIISGNKMSPRLTEFGAAQVELTCQTIRDIRPAAVVIANAAASRLAKQLLPLINVPGSQTEYTMLNAPETRFFLAGMLSGGGAMDTFSRYRLEHEVRGHLNERERTQ